MTDRVNHAEEARRWIDYSADLNPEFDWPRIAHASMLAASHAALAGVEEQRIANLLAYMGLPAEIHSTESDLWPEINEGLGLA